MDNILSTTSITSTDNLSWSETTVASNLTFASKDDGTVPFTWDEHEQHLSWDEYVAGANRTASPWFYGNLYREETALKVMSEFVETSAKLDRLKKALFYGKDVEQVFQEHSDEGEGPATIPEGYKWQTSLDPNLIHAILGIASEAVELVDLLVLSLQSDTEVNPIKLREELGDLFWYIALLPGMDKENLDLVLSRNLNKLKVRYPDKFSSELAINRDDNKELSAVTV